MRNPHLFENKSPDRTIHLAGTVKLFYTRIYDALGESLG